MAKEQNITIQEIVSTLHEGEKLYSGFKKGREVAQGLIELDNTRTKLEKEVSALSAAKEKANIELGKINDEKKETAEKAKELINNAEVKAERILKEANEYASESKASTQAQITEGGQRLSKIQDDVSKTRIEYDSIKAEMKALDKAKEDALKRITGGLS